MTKWNLVVDVARCNACNNCLLATKDEYSGNAFPGYSAPQPNQGVNWLSLVRKERGSAPMIDVSYYPVTCNHCDAAPCMNDQTAGVVRKRPDGIVLIDPDKARGRRDIAAMCPYGQIFWNAEQNVPQNWTFDAHLLDSGWKEPRCAQVCPTGALSAVKVSDSEMADLAKTENLATLRPELNAKPRIYYKNLDRVLTCFIGGSISAAPNGVDECCAGAKVTLELDGAKAAETLTDVFGDFKFDGLKAMGQTIRIQVESAAGGLQIKPSALFSDSLYLGHYALPASPA